MDGIDKERKGRSFKERLRFKFMGCFGSTTLSLRDEDEVETEEQVAATNSVHNPDPGLTSAAVPPLVEADEKKKGRSVETGSDSICCVCMERKKGAALIPCGHTFCCACARLLWVNRGSCPLCNRSILDTLDISPCSRSIRQILDIF